MKIYKVIRNQNIYDVSMTLFGTIEGVTDLLVYNPELSFDTQLTPGMELLWDDQNTTFPSILSAMSEIGITPANGERHVYYKDISLDPVCYIRILPESVDFTLKCSGDGHMFVNWGDNSKIEEIELSPDLTTYKHSFDGDVPERRIVIHGDFNIKEWDLTDTYGIVIPLKPITVDELVINKNNMPLMGLFLFKDTYSINISNRTIDDLAPIQDMSLSDLTLTNIIYKNAYCVDDYLIHIATNYGNRRNCNVVMDFTPSGIYEAPPVDENGKYIISNGMQAVYVILHEPEWNEAGKWRFVFDDVEYTVPAV